MSIGSIKCVTVVKLVLYIHHIVGKNVVEHTKEAYFFRACHFPIWVWLVNFKLIQGAY